MSNWDLDYDALKAVKPDIIMASLSAMGREGPWRDFGRFRVHLPCPVRTHASHVTRRKVPLGPGYAHAGPTIGMYAQSPCSLPLEFVQDRTGAVY